MPPDHGASVVKLILTQPSLRKLWEEELNEMRLRLKQTREDVTSEWNSAGPDISFIKSQLGMFSVLPLSVGQIERLRTEFGIYMANSGRINVAGLLKENITPFLEGLKTVMVDNL